MAMGGELRRLVVAPSSPPSLNSQHPHKCKLARCMRAGQDCPSLPGLCTQCSPRVVASTNSASSKWEVSFAVTSSGRLGETISFRRPAVSAFMREACVVFS